MSLLSATHTTVFLVFSSIVAGLPSMTARNTWDCPDYCNDAPSHPGCHNDSMICSRLDKMLEGQKSMDDLIATLKQDSENTAHSLLVMGTALFILVPILLLGLALIILKLYLPSFFKCLKKRSNPERRPSSSQNIGRKPSSTQNLRQLSVSTIRLANHQQSNESPRPARNRISTIVPHSAPVTEENKQQVAPPRKLMRQPSESTCPDESSDTHQEGDNLGISTSTLHNQSTSSSNRSFGAVNNSTRTMNTILPPDNSPNQSFDTRI